MTIEASLDSRKRINMAEALPLIGKKRRVAQQMAEAGEIPGAVKIRGEWTFNVTKLLAWLDELERQQCESRKAVNAAKPQKTANGEATPFTGGSASPASSSAGRYERAMSNLLKPELRRTSHN